MKTIWLVTNRKSGTTSPELCAAIIAEAGAAGLALAGQTDFPAQPLPDTADLAAAAVDTVLLYAGDGTVNATLRALALWDGGFLILPGGTMNLLAKQLHDTLDPHAIIAAAVERGALTAVPQVTAGAHRAFVGLIIGPAANWFRAREAVREGRFAQLMRVVRLAWSRTFRGHVRVGGLPSSGKGYQAVLITPTSAGLEATAIDARDWSQIAEIGWEWLSGDWLNATAVTHTVVPRLQTLGRKPVLGLFDGEPATLPRGTVIESSMTRNMFITTRTARR